MARHVVITGANSGIGFHTARSCAARGDSLTMLVRNRDALEVARSSIEAGLPQSDIQIAVVDLGSLESVAACSDELRAGGRLIDVLVNNAGVAGQRGSTADGFELAFGTNHLGHFALTEALLETLSPQGARIVNVASMAHYDAKAIDWDALKRPTKSVTGLPEYAVSKLCNVLYARELAARLPHVAVFSLHPGVVSTNVWRRIPKIAMPIMRKVLKMIPPEEGTVASLRAINDEELVAHSGVYLDCDGSIKAPNSVVTDALAEELVARSRTMITT